MNDLVFDKVDHEGPGLHSQVDPVRADVDESHHWPANRHGLSLIFQFAKKSLYCAMK